MAKKKFFKTKVGSILKNVGIGIADNFTGGMASNILEDTGDIAPSGVPNNNVKLIVQALMWATLVYLIAKGVISIDEAEQIKDL